MTNEVAKTETALRRIVPASDILEREDGFHIIMDIPGVVKEALAIEIEENELKVTGKVERQSDSAMRRIHTEFGPVEYVRTFTLTDMVDKDKVKASISNGVLDLFLPRAEAAKPRRIEVTT
ncbi:Hsp20/alpha crystallin family protein [Desulfovibrio mangrovi]|uniref:Hsp20/alpha crystallin family protein n=1 Tax=Desulfovibrio mangrovi TaxID=2976983 RepID=UPI0022466813|nr:Hsp20/alpha crystallin family protein [Desulfovibrio mangrovi]UZP67335.1 Hsp20/alpha crystallin family protein [Desulfovibrio mangrovi]